MKTSYLSPSLSLYLDILRIIAIVLLVFAHAQKIFHIELPLGYLRVSNEVFVLFIVTSGFLNQFQAQYIERNRRTYIVEKTSRIYSAVFVCLLFNIVCDGVGKSTNEAVYTFLAENGLFNTYSPIGFVSYISFTTDVWFRHVFMGSMTSYWSVSYIVLFYLYYGMTSFNPALRNVLLLLWVLLVGPIVALYLVFWVLGAATYDFIARHKDSLNPNLALFVFGFSIVSFFIAVIFAGGHVHAPELLSKAADINVMTYLYQLAIAIIVALSLVGFGCLFGYEGAHETAYEPSAAQRTIRWVAGGSLTIYMIYPSLLTAIRAIFAQSEHNVLLMLSAIVVVLVVGYLLAELGERSRDPYRSFVRGVFR